MEEIKELQGVARVEINREEGLLFIEKEDGGGIEVDLGIHELMHLLGAFTNEEWGNKEIYGIPDDPDCLEE